MLKKLASKMATSGLSQSRKIKDETDITERGDQGRDQHHDETDFTEQGEQRRIKKQGTKSTPDQGRERSKKILLKTKKQVTLIT